MIKITPVRNEKELKAFVELPYRLYKNNRYWVPPLRRDVYNLFEKKKYPFWEHAEREMFIAYRGKEVVGRVCAIVDYNFLEFWNEKTGYFGFFECEDDEEAAITLFNAVREYHREKGMTKFVGPFNPSTNEEVGFLLEGFFLEPMIMMTYTFEYYHKLAEASGLTKAKDLYAFYIETKNAPLEYLENICSVIRQRVRDLKVRHVDLDDFSNEVKKIKEVYNDAWSRNWGFVPMTDAEFNHIAKTLKDLVVPELVIIVEVDNIPVGVSLTVPNYNFILKKLNGNLNLIGMLKFLYYKNKIKEARLMIMGVKQEYQKLGLEALMFLETFKAGMKLGYQSGELSWTLEDNHSVNNTIIKMGGKLYKKYRIYQGLV
ncbi:MAG: N-acetyltransferase [candidate division WOR-3 bacterium]|nr:N-acetyltransferase [candidate division WOR-3 bacterium]